MTPTTAPDPDLIRMLDQAAEDYLRSLPEEHFMEAFAQGTQRKITLESFDLVRRARPEVHCFNEMLVQYPRKGRKKLGQVVPDNLIVVHPGRLEVSGHYSVTVQPARPFLVIEYVSKYNKRKDYDINFERYEELRVPYYLLYYPDNEELTLFRLAGDGGYESVGPDAAGRRPIPELELEVGLKDGWVRYWFRGELLPLPAQLADERDAANVRADAANVRADAANVRADAAQAARLAVEAENARLKAELERLKGG